MNRFQFVGAQDFMVPCDASLVFALEGRRELGRCVFDGSACFVLRAAARRGQQVEVICFSAGEELTPELGCDSKPASLDVELDSTQFKCELANLATPAGPALVCLLDGSAAFQIDLGRVTALLDGGDVSSAEAEAAADAPPLPPFVQLEFGPVAFRLYASLATPSNGEGSLAHMHACVVELLRFARSMRPAAQPGRDATSGRDAADLDALLDELSRADGYDAFVRAASRVGATYDLCALLAQLGHAHVDGKRAERLLHDALSDAAAAHAATFVPEETQLEAVAALSSAVSDVEAELGARCRALMGRNAADLVGDGSPPGALESEQRYALLADCAQHIAHFQLHPTRACASVSLSLRLEANEL